ncbi:hypothetical protein C0J52_14373, partial [Blattella germanica]
QNPVGTAVIPNIPGVSEKLKKIVKKFGIRTAFKSYTTLCNIQNTKPPNEQQANKNCVYNVPCECGIIYIGKTGRPLQTRINEHKRNTRNGATQESKLAEHSWETGHRIQWEEYNIV